MHTSKVFHYQDSGFGKNVVIFGTDMSSPVHIHNKKEDFLILDKGQVDDTYVYCRKTSFYKFYRATEVVWVWVWVVGNCFIIRWIVLDLLVMLRSVN